MTTDAAPPPTTDSPREVVVAYIDGACINNPGPGGWGVYIKYPNDQTLELGGGEEFSTNNRMELLAAIEAVRATLDCPAVTIITDSQYVQRGITQWIKGWKRNDWRTADGGLVKNLDLWTVLDELADPLRLRWEWRRGHAGDPGNERAHQLASSWAESACSKVGQRED